MALCMAHTVGILSISLIQFFNEVPTVDRLFTGVGRQWESM